MHKTFSCITEGIKYTGSKDKLLTYILELIAPLRVKTILDGFSGTTRVTQALAQNNYQVFSNDKAIWSKTFAQCYLLNTKPKEYYQEIINYLNELPGKYGWFSKHYGARAEAEFAKRPWQLHNTLKLDSIREAIDKIAKDEIEKAVLLTSLILALDKVDNTVGHYAAYLKKWSKRSYEKMKLKVPRLIPKNNLQHKVFQEDIFSLLPQIRVDLAYYDPPYGSNNDKMPSSRVRYQAYYHLWKTIIQNDRPPLFGAANRRKASSDKECYSPFEDFRKNENGTFIATQAIEKLIRETQARYILFSYSNSGRVPIPQLIKIFAKYTNILKIHKINYRKNVMSYMQWTSEWIQNNNEKHKEFLFLLKKR